MVNGCLNESKMMNNLSKVFLVALYLCSAFVVFAGPGTTDTEGTLEDVDAIPAPINDYIWILALLGLFVVFLKLKKHSKENSNSIL